jgi:2-polyprenyl-3-methyl-5-hydroxy-6-metoxy-1,4-benzoquinol methylase
VCVSILQFIRSLVGELREHPFDVILLSEVLERVIDPAELLRESLQHLKPDGIVLVTGPNSFGGFEIDSVIYGSCECNN